MTIVVRLKEQHLSMLRREARKAYPLEACGLLFGKFADKTEAVVTKIVVTSNALKSTTRFEIDPETFYDALTRADKGGLKLIGLFHSHPAPAEPSQVDVEFMRLWNGAVWLILSLTENEFAAFQMINGKVRSATIKVE